MDGLPRGLRWREDSPVAGRLRPRVSRFFFCLFGAAWNLALGPGHVLEGQDDSITWIDLRGLCDRQTLERMGEIFKIHPLALEDVVNVPQRPKSEVYTEHHLVISRAVELAAGATRSEQIGILFGKGFVVTVQEDPHRDGLGGVRERIRAGRGSIRTGGADYLVKGLMPWRAWAAARPPNLR